MSADVEQQQPGLTAGQLWIGLGLVAAAVFIWMLVAVWPAWLNDILISKKAFISAVFNGVTLAGLYFLVASGFTLVFGLMRNVNLAHGSLYLFGAYVGYEITERTGNWFVGVIAGFLFLAVVGVLLQTLVFRKLEGDDLRQTLVSIGISIVAADLMLAFWGGTTYQILTPDWLDGAIELPIVSAVKSNGTAVYLKYPLYRTVVFLAAVVIGIGLWLLLNRS
jgi:branched-chain amino acid transport system permease protein